MAGARLVHAELPIVLSPSGLPSQHIVTERTGSRSTFLGQQWLGPGDRVLLHTHPVEEAIMILSGQGEASMDADEVAITAGMSLFFPPGCIHGFRNTGNTPMQVVIIFPVPFFAETTIVETMVDGIG